MRLTTTGRRRLARLWVPGLSAFLVVYFTFHLVQGDHGLIARDRLIVEVDRATVILAERRAERARLEHQVERLAPQSIDPDLLDERARAMLGWAHPNDVIIHLPED